MVFQSIGQTEKLDHAIWKKLLYVFGKLFFKKWYDIKPPMEAMTLFDVERRLRHIAGVVSKKAFIILAFFDLSK